jgi:ABC-type lipoprotein export system ATPase subunit
VDGQDITRLSPGELVHYRGRKIGFVFILADEPAGNLDTQTSATIIELLRDLSRSEGTTVILVTHDDSIADQADRVLRLADGHLALSS